MTGALHHIVGLYPTRAAAESAGDEVRVLGLAPNQARVLLPTAPGGGEGAGADTEGLPGLVCDALAAGQCVLVVQAETEGQAEQARRIVTRSMAEAGR